MLQLPTQLPLTTTMNQTSTFSPPFPTPSGTGDQFTDRETMVGEGQKH